MYLYVSYLYLYLIFHNFWQIIILSYLQDTRWSIFCILSKILFESIFPNVTERSFLDYVANQNESYSMANVCFYRCHMHLFGPSGTMQNLDGLCVLPLNILHDKVYLILWFWYFILLAMTLLQFVYWLRFMCFPTQRYFKIKG